MKYKGKEISKVNREIIPLTREDGDIILIATAIENWDEFESLVSEPVPPEILKPGGRKIINRDDPKYKQEMSKYAEMRTSYMIVKSLSDTPDLEFELIDLKKPETWGNYVEEFRQAGVTEYEQIRIMQGVMRANALDEEMIKEARERFLQEASQQDK